MTHCRLMRTTRRAVGERGGESTFDSGGLVMLSPKETNYVHHVSTGPPKSSKVPTAMDDSKRRHGAVGEGKGESTFDSGRLVMPLSPKEADYVHHVSTGPPEFAKLPTALGDPKKEYLPLYGSMQNCQDSTNHGENFALTSKALCNFNHIATEHSSLAFGKTVNNIQAKHTTDFCSDYAVEKMDCNDESALSMGYMR